VLEFTEKANKFRQDFMRILFDFYVLITAIMFLIAVFFAAVFIGY
jgi:hypothetical protein